MDDVKTRWENGNGPRQSSIDLVQRIIEIDQKYGDDFLDLKCGGDGDNGSHLAYLFDIIAELDERKQQLNN